MKREEFTLAYNKCLNYLSISRRSIWQIKCYLSKKEFSQEVVDLVIKTLKERKLLNDGEYANQIINHYKNKESRRAIKERLKNARISENIIDNCLDFDEMETAKNVALKYLRSREYDKKKVWNYLYNKGFDSDSVLNAIKQCELQIKEQEDNE